MQHSITLGGRERRLIYTPESRRLIERAFPVNGTPGRLQELIRDHCSMANVGGSWDVQLQVLWAGLRTDQPGLTTKKVEDMLTAELASGKTIYDFLAPAVLAIFASGCLGYTWTPPDPDKQGEGSPEGNGAPPQ